MLSTGRIYGKTPQQLDARKWRDVDIYTARIKEGLLLSEIASKQGVSTRRVSQVVKELTIKFNKFPYGVICFENRGGVSHMALLARCPNLKSATILAKNHLAAKVIPIEEFELYKGHKFEYLTPPKKV
jgi:hypothetical protein